MLLLTELSTPHTPVPAGATVTSLACVHMHMHMRVSAARDRPASVSGAGRCAGAGRGLCTVCSHSPAGSATQFPPSGSRCACRAGMRRPPADPRQSHGSGTASPHMTGTAHCPRRQ
mgnify:CR=1 FL=1